MASIAIGMDSVLKKYCDAYREKGIMPPLFKNKLPGVLSSAPRNLRTVDAETGLLLTGKLDDCLELKKGVFAVMDHKTRASAPKEVHPTYQVQMDAYTYLLEANGYPTERSAFLVYYWPEPGKLEEGFPFGIEVKKLETNPDSIKVLLKIVKNVLEEEMPAASTECEFCSWAAKVK